jgi:alkanesulfonate monooxygenase SsuD/methylene tetrahydromethanopterin reductase-like flavin-dependent oxidoreductase (luciferase family)
LGDHLALRGPRLECWTTLSALAAATDKIRLATLVLCNSFRNPALLAKMAATLDVISNGRLEFGIGAGWHRIEYEAYGYPFQEPKVRIRQLREGVDIIRRMWTEDHPTYRGKYHTIRDAFCEPTPIQKPHPPITIGGGGEQLTLRVVARYADRSNLIGPIELCQHRLDVLKKHCAQIGRNYGDIEKSVLSYIHIGKNEDEIHAALKKLYGTSSVLEPFESWYSRNRGAMIAGTADECIQKIRDYERVGVTFFILRLHQINGLEGIRQLHDQIIACL